jgi:hypothetical protein
MTKLKPNPLGDDLPFSKARSIGRVIIKDTYTAEEWQQMNKGIPESQIQVGLESYLKAHELLYIHINDRIYKDPRIRHQYKGLPDLPIFQPQLKQQNGLWLNDCLVLELKRPLVGKLSGGQKQIGRHLNIYEVETVEHGIELIDRFMRI